MKGEKVANYVNSIKTNSTMRFEKHREMCDFFTSSVQERNYLQKESKEFTDYISLDEMADVERFDQIVDNLGKKLIGLSVKIKKGSFCKRCGGFIDENEECYYCD